MLDIITNSTDPLLLEYNHNNNHNHNDYFIEIDTSYNNDEIVINSTNIKNKEYRKEILFKLIQRDKFDQIVELYNELDKNEIHILIYKESFIKYLFDNNHFE